MNFNKNQNIVASKELYTKREKKFLTDPMCNSYIEHTTNPVKITNTTNNINAQLIKVMKLFTESAESHIYAKFEDNAKYGVIHLPTFNRYDWQAANSAHNSIKSTGKKIEGTFYKYKSFRELYDAVNTSRLDAIEKISTVVPHFQFENSNKKSIDIFKEHRDNPDQLPTDLQLNKNIIHASQHGQIYQEQEKNSDNYIVRQWMKDIPNAFNEIQNYDLLKDVVLEGINQVIQYTNIEPIEVPPNATLYFLINEFFSCCEKYYANKQMSILDFNSRFPEVHIMTLVHAFRINLFSPIQHWNKTNDKKISYLRISDEGLQWHHKIVAKSEKPQKKRRNKKRK